MSVTLGAIAVSSSQGNERPRSKWVSLTDSRLLDYRHRLFVNWANLRARLVLAMLDLGGDAPVLAGTCALPDFRRAVVRARALFQKRAGLFVRLDLGVDDSYLLDALNAAEAYALEVERRGATHIVWG